MRKRAMALALALMLMLPSAAGAQTTAELYLQVLDSPFMYDMHDPTAGEKGYRYAWSVLNGLRDFTTRRDAGAVLSQHYASLPEMPVILAGEDRNAQLKAIVLAELIMAYSIVPDTIDEQSMAAFQDTAHENAAYLYPDGVSPYAALAQAQFDRANAAEDERASDTPYVYPILPGTEEWRALSSEEERYAACDIPGDIAGAMTTRALLLSLLDYPMLGNIWTSTAEDGLFHLANAFSGLREFMVRRNAFAVWTEHYLALPSAEILQDEENGLIQAYYMELILAYTGIAENKSAELFAQIEEKSSEYVSAIYVEAEESPFLRIARERYFSGGFGRAYTIDTPYEYPLTRGGSRWESMKLAEERAAACAIPEDILAETSTVALWRTILDFPLYTAQSVLAE